MFAYGQTWTLPVGYQAVEYFLDGGYKKPSNRNVPIRPLVPHGYTQVFYPANGSVKGYVYPVRARNAGARWRQTRP